MTISNMQFKSQSYWEERYEEEDQYEWFESRYHDILDCIQNYCDNILNTTSLHLGCGNSKLGIELQQPYLINLDYCVNVLEKMSSKFKPHQTEWTAVDMRQLPFRSNSIDIVIDKGTLDALLCGVNAWNPEPEEVQDAYDALNEVHRVLTKDGVYIYATFGQPHFRKPLFELCNFKLLDTKILGDQFHYFVYFVKPKNK